MKIGVVVGSFPSPSETFIRRELSALQKNGWVVTVLALHTPPSRPQAAAPVVSPAAVHSRPRVLSWRVATAVAHWLRRSPRRFLRLWSRSLGEAGPCPLALARAARRLVVATAFAHEASLAGCERIHAHFAFSPGKVGRLVAELLGVPFSLSVHARDIYTQPYAAIKPLVDAADTVVCCTRHGLETIREADAAVADKLLLARHGLDLAEYPDATPAGDLVLGVGRLVKKKGFCYLIDACDILRQRGCHAPCQIVGGGPLYEALRTMIETVELGEAVKLAGPCTNEMVRHLLRSTAVLVLPSIEAPDGDRDGLANVLLEAMASGVPVVTTTASAAHEVIEDGVHGFLVPPHDPGALADQVQRLVEHPRERAAMGRAGRRCVEAHFQINDAISPLLKRFAAPVAQK